MTDTRAGDDGSQKRRGGRSGLSPLMAVAQAESLLTRERPFAAIATLEGVLETDPNHLGALELLAKAHWRAGHHEAALDALRHLIRLNPYEPGYHFLAGSAQQALGRYGEAVQAYSRCLDPSNPALMQAAQLAIQEVEGWQESVIAELLRSDPTFRVEYGRSPMAACRKRGFSFLEGSGRHSGTTPDRSHITVWERPS